MMISDTAVTMMMMVLVVMVMMMTVDRWQRVPMVGGFRGNGAPSPDRLLSVLFCGIIAPFVHHFLPRPVVRLLWTFVKKLFFRFKSGAH